MTKISGDIEVAIVTDLPDEGTQTIEVADVVTTDMSDVDRRVERKYRISDPDPLNDASGKVDPVLVERIYYYYEDEQVHHSESEWSVSRSDDGEWIVDQSGEAPVDFAESAALNDPTKDFEILMDHVDLGSEDVGGEVVDASCLLRKAAAQYESARPLKAARELLGWTRREMSERLGLSVTDDGQSPTLRDWERGRRRPQDEGRKRMRALADYLGSSEMAITPAVRDKLDEAAREDVEWLVTEAPDDADRPSDYEDGLDPKLGDQTATTLALESIDYDELAEHGGDPLADHEERVVAASDQAGRYAKEAWSNAVDEIDQMTRVELFVDDYPADEWGDADWID